MFLTGAVERRYNIDALPEVAIPSNRVNVSYERPTRKEVKRMRCSLVAIPSNRVNVSYIMGKGGDKAMIYWYVAIPSNRVNVSYITMDTPETEILKACGRNPLKSGQCFLPLEECKS